MKHELIITCILFFTLILKVYSQKNELPDTTMYKQLGMAGDDLHYLFKDTIKSTITNYNWPFFEINVLSGLDLNNWVFASPEKDYSLNVVEFKEEFDGIKRITEMGNYEIEIKLNTPHIELFALYNSHYLSYQKSLDKDELLFANNIDYKSKEIPTNKNEIRLGFNIIIKKSKKTINQSFNTLINSGLKCEIFTNYSRTVGDTTFYKNTKFVDVVYNYTPVEKIITHTYTTVNIGFIRPSFPLIYKQEPQYIYYPELDYCLLTSYLLHWHKYSMNGLSFGIMQRNFKRYKVEIHSPIKKIYGLGLDTKGYRCNSIEYGANFFLGTKVKLENPLPFDLSQTGGEIYFKTSWEPFMLKFNGGKMIGRPDDWFIRASIGFTIRGGKTILDYENRVYVVKDYL
ncbi:MAG: hypothetical protein R6W78_01120 [Bacteroidales bacterium]